MLFLCPDPTGLDALPLFPLGDICVGVSSAVRVVGRRRGGGGGEEGEESDTRTGALPFYGGVNFLTVLSGKAAERAIQSS